MRRGTSSFTLYFLFGTAFLPGFLSDAYDSRTAYAVDSELPNYKTEGIVSYEVVPLRIREKRQVTITVPSSPPGSGSAGNTSNVQGTIWANKTRDANAGQTQDKNPLLRNPANNFFSNSETNHGSHVTLESEKYDNGTVDLPEFPPEDLDEIAKTHNLTLQSKIENFLYYETESYPPPKGLNYWVDMNLTKHEMLSNAHRRAATIKLKFDFLFYGHTIKNVTVATGGFIYLGDQVHAWLAATQYVAPLMANFDSSTLANSTVSYHNGDKFFTVEWSQLVLHDSPDKGNFTFQTTLHENGTIVFVYKNIPIPIIKINDTHHPVKVGLSDAYIRDRSLLVIKQKTIYEYHRVDLKDKDGFHVVNGSAIIFRLQETCHTYKTCEACTAENVTVFDCVWCPKLNRCSNGLDRYKQEWIVAQCDKEETHVKEALQCTGLTYNHSDNSPSSSHRDDEDNDHGAHSYPKQNTQDQYRPDTSQVTKSRTTDSGGTSAGGVIAIMFFVIIVFAAVGWVAYAYFYPHTPSGQLLIRYRPAQWAFRRGEARYTAASIHM